MLKAMHVFDSTVICTIPDTQIEVENVWECGPKLEYYFRICMKGRIW